MGFVFDAKVVHPPPQIPVNAADCYISKSV